MAKKVILHSSLPLCIQHAILGDEYGNGPHSSGTISFQRGRSGSAVDSINSSSCHSSFLCPPFALTPPPPFFSNTFRPMILDEQSQKQNELEQPRWEQMARNCLVEEARESIFTRPGGVAVARRGKKKKKKSAGAFVLIRYGLEEASEKYSSHAY